MDGKIGRWMFRPFRHGHLVTNRPKSECVLGMPNAFRLVRLEKSLEELRQSSLQAGRPQTRGGRMGNTRLGGRWH